MKPDKMKNLPYPHYPVFHNINKRLDEITDQIQKRYPEPFTGVSIDREKPLHRYYIGSPTDARAWVSVQYIAHNRHTDYIGITSSEPDDTTEQGRIINKVMYHLIDLYGNKDYIYISNKEQYQR